MSNEKKSKHYKEPSPNWGGTRKGAGAKKKEKRHSFRAYITESKAKEWGNGNIKRGVFIVKSLTQKKLDNLKTP
jgi:hypothetical protein